MRQSKLLIAAAIQLFLIPTKGMAQAKCSLAFLREFKSNYAVLECLSRQDMVCLRSHLQNNSTIIGVPITGATVVAVSKFASKEVAAKAVPRLAWATVAAGTYFLATKIAGAALGFVLDSSPTGGDPCADEGRSRFIPWQRVNTTHCTPIYKTTNNEQVGNFLKLDNESQQLSILDGNGVCEYYQNLNSLLKTQTQVAADEMKVKLPSPPSPPQSPSPEPAPVEAVR